MEALISVETTPLAALQEFLGKLLYDGLVDVLLVPMRTLSGTVTHALVSNPDRLVHADPLAPVLPNNGATLVGKLSVRKPRARLGAVLRSCEIRALVELTKMQQASLEDVLLISLDCAGTYNVPAFLRKSKDDISLWQALYQQACANPSEPDADLRLACKMCEQPVYEAAPISIQFFGSEVGREIRLSLSDEMGEKLGLSPAQPSNRKVAVEKVVAARITQRDLEFAALRDRLEGQEDLSNVFAACIRCHNCMTVCPICYCKTCVFKSAVFDHEPAQFVDWTRQKGALRMPTDTTLFHLTRLNHMALSCVGCGMCSEACPAELPVGLAFRLIGQQLQSVFEYAPGRSLDDPLPLVTFKADEWTEVGE